MRDKVRAFYYPDFVPDNITLKKAILLFDEIHFMDRPSFTFYLGEDVQAGGFGLIGANSPLRSYEASFRENGVPLYVHSAPGGPIRGELLENVRADVKDTNFLLRFQEGLRQSDRFLELHVPNANYAGGETQSSIAHKLSAVNLRDFPSPLDVYFDKRLRPFEYSTDEHVVKELVRHAMTCSAKMNFALSVGAKHGFSPLADARPFNDLVSAKYTRALDAISKKSAVGIPSTDLSMAILDELVPSDRLYELTLGEVVTYRRESVKAREAFMEHLAVLENKLSTVRGDQDYGDAIKNLIVTEIRPAASRFQNEMATIYERLFGALLKRGMLAGTAALASTHLWGDLSWQHLCTLSVGAGSLLVDKAIDAFLETRKAKRECALSYLLDVIKN